MILLPDCPEYTAISISKKINKQLETHAFEHQHQFFELSFSIGIALSQNGDTPALIIEHTDKASYWAKVSGDEVILPQTGRPILNCINSPAAIVFNSILIVLQSMYLEAFIAHTTHGILSSYRAI